MKYPRKCRHCENIINEGYRCDDCFECECGKCDSCSELNEIAYENYLQDFYGSSEPFTLYEKDREK